MSLYSGVNNNNAFRLIRFRYKVFTLFNTNDKMIVFYNTHILESVANKLVEVHNVIAYTGIGYEIIYLYRYGAFKKGSTLFKNILGSCTLPVFGGFLLIKKRLAGFRHANRIDVIN